MQFDFDLWQLLEKIPEEVIAGFQSYTLTMVLLILLIVVSRWQGLGIESKLIVGTIRGTIQILLLALILYEIFALQNLIIIFVVLIFMCTFAAHTAKSNLDHIPGVTKTAFPGILVGGLFVMLLVVILGIIPPTGEYLIPMGGMVIGNTMNLASLVLDRMWSLAQKQRSLLETALALGASSYEATKMTITESIRSGLLPNLNRYAALGIVTIPGFMSGLIIGGANVIVAALYQVIVFIMIFLACVICGIIVSRIFLNEMFNDRLQILVPPETE